MLTEAASSASQNSSPSRASSQAEPSRYFSDGRPGDGPILYPNNLDCLAVLIEKGGWPRYAGIADPAGEFVDPTEQKHLAVYRLLIRGTALDGLWTCKKREFVKVDTPAGRLPDPNKPRIPASRSIPALGTRR